MCSLQRGEKVRTFEGKILAGWEKSKNRLGIPYFINHLCHQTQWDHPILRAVMDEMFDHNIIKFTAYRMAVKLQSLQRVLKLHQVSLAVLMNILDQLPLQHDLMDMTLTCVELEEVIREVFNLASREKSSLTDSGLATELTWNFLLNFLDPFFPFSAILNILAPTVLQDLSFSNVISLKDFKRKGTVRVLSVVVTLLVLCDGKLHDKYKYLFRRLADHNNSISRTKMTVLLNELAAIPEYFSEKLSFGPSLVSAAIDSCFRNHVGPIGIREESFFVWLLKEPQTLVWLSTFYRLTTAELVSHNVKCVVCKMFPINGLRYQCLKCFNYDLCQHCFFTGQMSHGHKIKHPMQEYYAQATSREGIKAVMKQIGSKLHICKNRTSYLPINPSDCSKPDLMKTEVINPADLDGSKMISKTLQTDDFPTECCSRAIINGTPFGSKFSSQQSELESIIGHLENENRPDLMKTEVINPADLDGSKMISKTLQTDDFPTECCSRAIINGTPFGSKFSSQQSELESIIGHLESENRNLMQEIKKFNSSPTSSGSEEGDSVLKRHTQIIHQELLEDFSQHLELQIYRLKRILKTYRQVQVARNLKQPIPLPTVDTACMSVIPKAKFSHISPIQNVSHDETKIMFPIVAGHIPTTKKNRPSDSANTLHDEQPSLLSSTAVSPHYRFSESFHCLAQSCSDSGVRSPNEGSSSNDSFGLTTTSKFTLSSEEDSAQLLSSVQLELDEILEHLKEIFPTAANDNGTMVTPKPVHHSQLLQAAVDVGNVLSEMVQNITLREATVSDTSS